MKILDDKTDTINYVYNMIDEKIKKLKNILIFFEQEKINININEFINHNLSNEKNIEELIDFDNFLKST